MLRIVGKTYDCKKELLERVAKATFSYLQLTDTEIELKFVSKREITRLNQVYRSKSGPTDVLSFAIDEKPLLGQIFICYTFTKTQAETIGKDLCDEIALLLVHGILHIAGFDHISAKQEVEMQKTETIILERVGIDR